MIRFNQIAKFDAAVDMMDGVQLGASILKDARIVCAFADHDQVIDRLVAANQSDALGEVILSGVVAPHIARMYRAGLNELTAH